MTPVATLCGLVAAALAGVGLVQIALGLVAVRRFAGADTPAATACPPVTILKPLHGDEPMLEAALESFFTQDYPALQLVFGVHGPTDPAIATVRALRRRYPTRDVELVIDGARHGVNHKISNLINMLPSARHDLLVVADSDVHAAPDYLRRIVAALEQPGTGVVTTLYAGRQAHAGLPGTLGRMYISHVFLPGALLARALGRQDCLGATMALRRATLDALGGLPALVDHLADDAVLGRLAVRYGLAVRLAHTVPTTTVPETTFGALYQHELRWARTIRSLAPVGHALSLVQFPVFWAALAVLATGSGWAVATLGAAWVARAASGILVDRRLQLPGRPPIWTIPLRDCLSVAIILASYRGRSVRWRGEVITLARPAGVLGEPSVRAYRATEPRWARADDAAA